MKRTISALLLVMVLVLVLVFSGCSNLAEPFLGKWSYDYADSGLGMYYIFEKKGVLKAQTLISEAEGRPALDYGTYKVVDEDTILMTDTFGEEKEYTYEFAKNGTKLTISDADYIMGFTKVEPEE
ncbi:MAG TPA: hypothetical protein PK629_04130 [Oscillospiraceae bacterium]|nr:hypothetical protein [Oscillospiraceae bacterium]HPK35195.1 hypothetical protein [Oscillospiraceae bacterium]HPR74998.1 hypothetical protein [Oscillospiraceae bacterium]